jgi:hypothetical protein
MPGADLVYAATTVPSLRTLRANLNRFSGLRGDGLTGGLANQEQEGNNQTHMLLIGGLG